MLPPVALMRGGLAMVAAAGALALLSACSSDLDTLRTARRIEVSVVGVSSTTVVIDDPDEVATIAAAARRARPTLVPVAWTPRHSAAFVLQDGRTVKLGFASHVPDLVGVKLPGAKSSEDHDYPPTLRALLEPRIEQAEAMAKGR